MDVRREKYKYLLKRFNKEVSKANWTKIASANKWNEDVSECTQTSGQIDP